MADTNFRGPVNSMGALEVDAGTTASPQPFDGPSGSYQGYTLLDPRNIPFPAEGMLPGRVPAFMCTQDIVTLDAIPQAASTTILAAAQAANTALVPLALATVAVTNFSSGAASIAVGVPLLPQGTTVVQTVIALDFGFTTGTTVANSSTVTVADNTLFTQGQWICIGNVGNAAGTQSLFTQVQTISTTSTATITVAPSPATALGVPIGGANLFGAGLLPPATQFGPSSAVPTSVSKTLQAGLMRVHNPRECLARNLVVEASSSTGGTASILVTGYDVWGMQVAELLTASGTTAVYGKKGFKYILNAVPQQTGAANYTLGVGDVFSFPLRADEAQQLQIWAGNTTVNNNVGFLAAVTTPATNTTGDVRGTIQLSGLGGGTPISSVATSNNVLRLYVIQNMSVDRLVTTTPNNLTPMFGTTQAPS